MLVQDVMRREPVTIFGHAHVKEAVDLLARHRISSLPVVDVHGRLQGIVTEIDLIRDAVLPDIRTHLVPEEGSRRPPATLVSEVMSSPAIVVHETNDLADVVELMATARLKSIPVVDRGEKVVGIVSRSDVIRTRARTDDDLGRDVSVLLADLGHPDWRVQVSEGVVTITGPGSALDRSIAEVAARSVRGVAAVDVG